ncbi:MAG TPA: response regulator, partial [Arenibaculum sp.]|nr:response regulator [Arenibaculum sp.]
MTLDNTPGDETAKLAFTGDASRSLLIVDDDQPFRNRLARAMEKRGFDVVAVESVAMGIEIVHEAAPSYAVVDLRLGDGSGLDVV